MPRTSLKKLPSGLLSNSFSPQREVSKKVVSKVRTQWEEKSSLQSPDTVGRKAVTEERALGFQQRGNRRPPSSFSRGHRGLRGRTLAESAALPKSLSKPTIAYQHRRNLNATEVPTRVTGCFMSSSPNVLQKSPNMYVARASFLQI
jgi:hypothetical protein